MLQLFIVQVKENELETTVKKQKVWILISAPDDEDWLIVLIL